MNSRLINASILLLATLTLPAQATPQQDALDREQEQFLNARPSQTEQNSLEAEQDRFLKAKIPTEPRYHRQLQTEYATEPRWTPVPVVRPQVARQALPIVPAAEPVRTNIPIPMERNIAPVQTVQVSVPVAKPLPSLSKPEGYSRVTPLEHPKESAGGDNLPSLVVPINSTPPQIAFALPPSLDGFLRQIQVGAEKLLYPLVRPVAITSGFGWRNHPIFGGPRFHAGIDLGASIGSPILAAFTGTVVSADWMGGYGNAVLLQHGAGLRSLYGHLSRPMVRAGQVVMQGTVIGLSGSTGYSTGPHLHFELRHLTGGEWVAFDPGNDLKAAQRELAGAMQQISQLQAMH